MTRQKTIQKAQQKRILVITEYFPSSERADITGGVEAVAFSILTRLAKKHKKHELWAVTVIASRQPGQSREQTVMGVRVIRPGPVMQYSNQGNIVLRSCFALNAFLAALRIPTDIVAGYSLISYVPAELSALIKGVPAVATYHESWAGGDWIRHKGLWTGLFGEVWERFALLLPWKKIIAVSGVTKAALVKRGIPEQKVVVVHNGVDTKEIQVVLQQVMKKRNKINKLKKSVLSTVCCVSRLVPTKRVDVLIHALALVQKDIPNVVCRIVGVGPEEQRLRSLAEQLGVSGNVVFVGRLGPKRDVLIEMARAHVFALPSSLEGFGIVVIEAAALGMPYVCSDIPALREATQDGKGGMLVPVGDAKAMAAAIIRILKSKKEAAQLSAAGQRLAREYDWDVLAGKVIEVYKSL